jgi:pyruvate kinase
MNLKKTKIVCTIGPASWDPQVMKAMIDAGMNCARINGAFADEAELDKVTKLVRDISDEVSLMVDVKGPEVRMNKFAAAIPLKPGDELVIGNDSSSDIYPANYADLYKHLKVGQRILIGDGDVELKVTSIEGDKMNVVVVFGEALKPGKAMNLPGADIASQILTEKDKTNLKHAMNLGWDFVSASFIQNAEAAREVNDFLKGSNMKLIAKIEDQAGVDNIDEILEEVDGIMLARGGL